MDANGNGLNAENMIAAVEQAQGFVSEAARLLGCSRKHFYSKLKNYPTVQQALEDVREKRHDYVESQLMKKIKNGDTACIIFYLKTQCKARGYIERQEITGADAGPIQIKVVYDEPATANGAPAEATS